MGPRTALRGVRADVSDRSGVDTDYVGPHCRTRVGIRTAACGERTMGVAISRSRRHVTSSLRASRRRGCGRRQRLGRGWPELTTPRARSNTCRAYLFRRCGLGRPPGGSLANCCSTKCTKEHRLWRCCGRRVSQQKTSTTRYWSGNGYPSAESQDHDGNEQNCAPLLSEVLSSSLPSEYARSCGLVWRRLPQPVFDTAPGATAGLASDRRGGALCVLALLLRLVPTAPAPLPRVPFDFCNTRCRAGMGQSRIVDTGSRRSGQSS